MPAQLAARSTLRPLALRGVVRKSHPDEVRARCMAQWNSTVCLTRRVCQVAGSPSSFVLKQLSDESDHTIFCSVMPSRHTMNISTFEIARSLRESRFFVRQRSGVGLDSFVRRYGLDGNCRRHGSR